MLIYLLADDDHYVKNRKVTKKKVKPSEEDINVFKLFGFPNPCKHFVSNVKIF